MSTLLSVYLFHVLAFQHKLFLIHMISNFSVLSLCIICFKNNIASTKLWVDVDFVMTAVEVKGMGSKYS